MEFSNREIINGIIESNDFIIDYIYNEYMDEAITIVNKLGGTRIDAFDVVQEVLMDIFYRVKYKKHYIDNFKSFFFTSVQFRFISMRKSGILQTIEPDLEFDADIDYVEDTNVEYEENEIKLSLFLKAFNKLPEFCKKLFTYKSEKYTYKQMSPLLNNISEDGLRMRRKRCLEMFYKLYEH